MLLKSYVKTESIREFSDEALEKQTLSTASNVPSYVILEQCIKMMHLLLKGYIPTLSWTLHYCQSNSREFFF